MVYKLGYRLNGLWPYKIKSSHPHYFHRHTFCYFCSTKAFETECVEVRQDLQGKLSLDGSTILYSLYSFTYVGQIEVIDESAAEGP